MLVAELSLMHPEAGTEMLQRVFGFDSIGGVLRLGTQMLSVTQASGPRTHGRIDHIALAVPDIDVALARMTGAGAALDVAVTPNGPKDIPEFWETGIRYVFVSGPEGARIELCQRNTDAVDCTGHDHIGIPCRDIAAMQAFFEAHGATLMASVDLIRDGALIPVRFLAFADGVIELYAPRQSGFADLGLWSGLRVKGLTSDLEGPDGLILAPL